MPKSAAAALIAKFGLLRHLEGGAFRETYRADLQVSDQRGLRNASTAIYFFLEKGDFSAFHRIAFDEAWHFYAGGPLKIVEISPEGELKETLLGSDFERGESFQHVVPGGSWFASLPLESSAFSFVGCTVVPGFDFADFELAERASLIALYPQHRSLIEALINPRYAKTQCMPNERATNTAVTFIDTIIPHVTTLPIMPRRFVEFAFFILVSVLFVSCLGLGCFSSGLIHLLILFFVLENKNLKVGQSAHEKTSKVLTEGSYEEKSGSPRAALNAPLCPSRIYPLLQIISPISMCRTRIF